MVDELVGTHEIAEMLGLTRQRVHVITRTHDDFPDPIADLACGRIWKKEEVVKWARLAGRLPKTR